MEHKCFIDGGRTKFAMTRKVDGTVKIDVSFYTDSNSTSEELIQELIEQVEPQGHNVVKGAELLHVEEVDEVPKQYDRSGHYNRED